MLGLDIGERRIGVALSDPEGILATPFTIIDCRDEEAAFTAIIQIVERQGVGTIVVGLPRTLGGAVGEQAEKVQAFVEKLRRRTQVPLELRDERLTTVMARRLIQAAEKKKSRKKVYDDAAAAAVLLQGYLDQKRGSE